MLKQILIFAIPILLSSCEVKKPSEKNIQPQSEIFNQEKSSNDLPQKNLKKVESKTQKKYFLGELKISLTQIKSDEYSCKSKIVISKNGKELDEIEFTSEPVGGDYGISKGTKIDDHFIFTKHGDYDGRTLIINQKGKIFNIIGGENYYDASSQWLFTNYESDLTGFAIFDLNKDSTLLTMDGIEVRPMSFHKAINERHFMIGINEETNEKSIWEFEIDLGSIMQLELDENSIHSKNELKNISIRDIDCTCEK